MRSLSFLRRLRKTDRWPTVAIKPPGVEQCAGARIRRRQTIMLASPP